MWDQRFDTPEHVYGREPNEFLVEQSALIPKGRVLSLAEGEGRNAVYLALQGYEVTALDASRVGLQKTEHLASESGVPVHTLHQDLAHYAFEPDAWQGIIAIYCHLPCELRKRIHSDIVKSLAPGGVYIMESFSQEQLKYGTGGPKSPDHLMDLDSVKTELQGLEFRHAAKVERHLDEGAHHSGLASVVQVVGVKAQV
ncbi:MAG: class I SAM-dependent methyltransferase [candidate division KSB1 bacterium]|nr:class I SAM-dependent methyltransferase [candidate division KSB1 bacterium]